MSQNNKICIHAIISGKVQGVFFRDTTMKKAHELKLTGWIKNLSEGNVELVACGDQDSIMILTEWLWEGPEKAEVSNVHWEEIPNEHHDSFKVC